MCLHLAALLGAQVHHLHPPGEDERGLIQAYIDHLLVVAHTLQDFVYGGEALAAYMETMGVELNPASLPWPEGIPGLHLRLCPNLAAPWHSRSASESVPYLGLRLQPEARFSLQQKQLLRLVAAHQWCLNTLAPANVIQDVIPAVLGG